MQKAMFKKVKRCKGSKLYVKWKAMMTLLTFGLIKKTQYKWMNIFQNLKSFGGRMKVELDLPNYATNADLKNATGVDTSKFAKKVDFAGLKSEVDQLDINKLEKVPTGLNSLKSKVDKLDVDKLVPVPVVLSKLSDVVKNKVKKDVYNAKIEDIEDKIPSTTNVASNAALDAK